MKMPLVATDQSFQTTFSFFFFLFLFCSALQLQHQPDSSHYMVFNLMFPLCFCYSLEGMPAKCKRRQLAFLCSMCDQQATQGPFLECSEYPDRIQQFSFQESSDSNSTESFSKNLLNCQINSWGAVQFCFKFRSSGT